MKKYSILLMLLLPGVIKAQDRLPNVDIFYGISLQARPKGLDRSMTFQIGTLGELGGRVNIRLKNHNYVFLSPILSREVFHVEAYFQRADDEEKILVTPDMAKVNSLIFTPFSIETGYAKLFNNNALISIGLQTKYMNKVKRKFKIATDEFVENYSLINNLFLEANAMIGYKTKTIKPLRIDLIIGYSISSYAANSSFHPIYSGFRISHGLL